jgi:hypothetical protein
MLHTRFSVPNEQQNTSAFRGINLVLLGESDNGNRTKAIAFNEEGIEIITKSISIKTENIFQVDNL